MKNSMSSAMESQAEAATCTLKLSMCQWMTICGSFSIDIAFVQATTAVQNDLPGTESSQRRKAEDATGQETYLS